MSTAKSHKFLELFFKLKIKHLQHLYKLATHITIRPPYGDCKEATDVCSTHKLISATQNMNAEGLYELLAAFAKLQKRLLASSFLSVRPSAWNNSDPTGRIFMKFDI